jgi:hypothetical protein
VPRANVSLSQPSLTRLMGSLNNGSAASVPWFDASRLGVFAPLRFNTSISTQRRRGAKTQRGFAPRRGWRAEIFDRGGPAWAGISFRVFRLFRGYLPSVVVWPAVTARLEQVGRRFLSDERWIAEPDHWSQRRGARRVCREVAGCPASPTRRGSVPAFAVSRHGSIQLHPYCRNFRCYKL